MDSIRLFLTQHAIVNSAEMADAGVWSLEDTVLKGLTEEQMRVCPGKGMNSIAWLLWHLARTEDVTVNHLLAGRPQVLDDEWLERLNLTVRDIGTGMGDEEVADVSARVNIEALRAYRVAVGRRTREVAQSLRPEELDEPIDPAAAQQLLSEGALAQSAYRLADFWGANKKSFILAMPATGHAFMHLAEAAAVRRLVK